MRGPLDGLTVVDLSSGMPGALATMLLADNGARVIKVEPQGGDPFRSFPPTAVWSRGKDAATCSGCWTEPTSYSRAFGRARLQGWA